MQKTEAQILVQQIIPFLESLGYEYIEPEFRLEDKNYLSSPADIVILDNERKPFIVVEAKKNLPENLTKFHPAVDQAYQYARKANAPFFMVTDGKTFNWFAINQNLTGFDLILDIPRYKNFSGPRFQDMKLKLDDAINHLYSAIDLLRGSLKSNEYTEVLFALLLAKIFDEDTVLENGAYQFSVLPGESETETKERVSRLFQGAIENRNLSFDRNLIENLDSTLVQDVVKRIEFIQVKGSGVIEKLIEEMAGISQSEFHTPSSIRSLVSQLFDFFPGNTVLDPAAGTGGFLTSVSGSAKKSRQDTSPHLIGVEKNRTAAFMAATNLNAADLSRESTLILADFFSEESRSKLHNISPNGFDYVISAPPFGGFNKSGKPYEAAYVEAIVRDLKPAGYAAIVLPEGFLFNPRYRENREKLISQTNILTVISLPIGTFHPFSGVKASILIFRKKSSDSNFSKTLFLRIPEDKKTLEENFSKAALAYRQFIKTNKLVKNEYLSLSPVNIQINPENGYRLDYSAYASEYIQVIDQLKKANAPIVSLGDIAKVRLGYLSNDKLPDGVPIISMSDLKNDWFLSKETNTSLPLAEMLQKGIYLKPGDLLLSSLLVKDNSVFMVPENSRPAIANRSLLVISPDPDKVIPSYLFALFRHEVVKVQLERLSVGSSMRSATPRLLREIQIPLIPLQKQKQIGEFIIQYQMFQVSAKEMLQHADVELSALLSTKTEEAEDENS
jgi:type I restriction-modification system DNA methylase subunit